MISRLRFFTRLDLDPTELILKKIEVAEELYNSWKEVFLRDEEFLRLLEKYEISVLNSNQVMQEKKTFEECYICTVLDGKGCCKAGLENEMTINILLLNMFLKKEIPKEREVPGRCFFVGPLGCKIFGRPYLCREFFCKRILDKLSQKDYATITQYLNEELTLLYLINNYIKNLLEFLMGEFLLELDVTGYS